MGVAGAKGTAHNPHPPGWLVKGNAQFHGTEAWRDAVSCAACHDQGAASNCVACHKSGASGGNPHPPGWHSGQAKTSAGCANCH